MDRLSRPVVAAFAALLLVGVALILLGGSGEGDDEDAPAEEAAATSVAPHQPGEAEGCGIDVPAIAGTQPAPVCTLGFGIAIPDGWNASRLDPDALERLASAQLSRPSFVPAARTAAAAGAVFYAAGVDDDGAVADLKVDVGEGVDTDPAAIEAAARAVVEGGDAAGARIVEVGADGARVDFQGTSTSAETGEAIEFHGAHLLVPDGHRLWSLIVTAESTERRDELVEIFSTSLTFA